MGDGGTDSVVWSRHAKRMWADRADPIAVEVATSLDDVWTDAVSVHYPPARGDVEGYYHRLGDVVILAKPDNDDPDVTAIVSVIDLTDRPDSQQSYVREQATPTARPSVAADGGERNR